MTLEIPAQIRYDFSVLSTEYFLLSKKEQKSLEKEYISRIRQNSPSYLENYLKMEELTILHPIDSISTIFDSGKKIKLVAAKIALYDLKNNLYSVTETGLIPLCSLEERLDRSSFKKYIPFNSKSA